MLSAAELEHRICCMEKKEAPQVDLSQLEYGLDSVHNRISLLESNNNQNYKTLLTLQNKVKATESLVTSSEASSKHSMREVADDLKTHITSASKVDDGFRKDIRDLNVEALSTSKEVDSILRRLRKIDSTMSSLESRIHFLEKA